MRLFCPENNLVVSRSWWLISLSKIWLFLNLIKNTSQFSKIWRIRNPRLFFYFSLSGCWVCGNFVIFHYIKVAEHIWEPRHHLAAEIGNWFPRTTRILYSSTLERLRSKTFQDTLSDVLDKCLRFSLIKIEPFSINPSQATLGLFFSSVVYTFLLKCYL